MKNNRRKFIKMAALAGSTASILPLAYSCLKAKTNYPIPDYSALDKILQLPVLKRELFPSPVIIQKTELLQDRNNFICRVRSNDGAEGVSIGHPFISKNSYPMSLNILVPCY
jgi:hypothetical protein